MSCCPATAWKELKNVDYEPKGTIDQVGDLKIYRVGSSSKCIVWNYDVFGLDGGRTKQMADFLAANGFMVVLPDYYRGKMIDPRKEGREKLMEFVKIETDWENKLKKDWDTVRNYAESHGAKSFGAIGTCWGSYVVLRLCSDTHFRAGISLHPSHTPIAAMLLESEEELLKEVKCPQMFMPAGDDHENVRAGGLGKKILGDGLEIIEFPDMTHGWSVRGDLAVENVDRDVKKTFNFVLTFFGKNL